ncbi:MmcQ/YjbR family DNA-binding protein [Nonomuraea sp. NPDC050536]|uniref:MmcQ/YjbR family DNA-binding protein n=1 Tax=Nonomuraea sp. NPDC050536 TaxID=3364366 RepID=UPI0037C8F931
MATTQQLFDDLSQEYLIRPTVSTGRMLHAEGLKVNGKVFAFLSNDRLILKLPAERVIALVANGEAHIFTSGNRKMREWVAITTQETWEPLLAESYTFVTSQTRAP